MESVNIKVNQPWYARGTPIRNPRDGPAMALSNKPLFAIREGPSARCEPQDKICSWLTLKTVFFNTQKRAVGQGYAQIRPLADDMIVDNEIEFVKYQTRRVDKIIEMYMTENIKTRRVDMIMANEMVVSPKPQWGKKIIIQMIIKPGILTGFRGNTDIKAIILPSAKSGLKTKIRPLVDDMIVYFTNNNYN